MKKFLGLACFWFFALSLLAEYERYEVILNVRLDDGTELETYFTDYGAFFIGKYNEGDSLGQYYPQYEIIDDDSIRVYTCRIKAVHTGEWGGVKEDVYLPVEAETLSRENIRDVLVTEVRDVELWLSVLEDMYDCDDREWIEKNDPADYKFYYYDTSKTFGFHVYIYEYSPLVEQVVRELDQFQKRIEEGAVPEPYSDSFFKNEEGFENILRKLKGEKVLVIRESSD